MDTQFVERHNELRENMAKLGKAIPEVMGGFAKLHGAAAKDGALDGKTKELLALAIGIVVRCDGCIAFHMHDALKAGASREEILDTIGVAILMGGGPAMVYGTEALTALDQFEKAGIEKPKAKAQCA